MTPREFWGENYYQNPPLTPDMLRFSDSILGFKLPSRLIELLTFQNGGYTKGFGFPMSRRTSWAVDHIPMDDLFGIVPNMTSSAHNMVDTELLDVNLPCLPEKQVLLTGDGHWWITLDYRTVGEPSVLWADVEMNEFLTVATSFEIFYSGLRPTSEFLPDTFETIQL